MIAKLFLGSVVGLGLLLSNVLVQANRRKIAAPQRQPAVILRVPAARQMPKPAVARLT